MYSISDLSAKAQIDLINIAEEMGIRGAKRMEHQDLIYKILDKQAVQGFDCRPAGVGQSDWRECVYKLSAR